MTCTPTLHCKIDTSSNLNCRFDTTSNLKAVIASDGSITAKFSLPTQVTPTLKCKIDTSSNLSSRFGTTSNLKAVIASAGSLTAKFSIPTQVEAEKFYGSYEYTPSWGTQILPTANKLLDANIQIDPIQTYETSNLYGTTFII